MNPFVPRAVVVIPTYNERDNLEALVEAIVKMPSCSVVIVDDGSPDGTGRIADELSARHGSQVSVLHRQPPRSFARSYIDGLRHALAHGAEVVCQMDADGSHHASYLPRLIGETANVDVVVGSRYAPGGAVRDWPWHRRLLSAVANRYVRAITGLRVHDATSGFKCWRVDALAATLRQPLESHGYALQFEMLFHAARDGYRIAELPIVFVERRRGRSKMSWGMIGESMATPFRLVMRARAANRRTARVPS